MEPTDNPVIVPPTEKPSYSRRIILALCVLTLAGLFVVFQLGLFSSPRSDRAPQPQAESLQEDPSPSPSPPPVSLTPIPANFSAQFTFPDISTSRSIDPNELPIAQDALVRKDAQDIVIRTLTFTDNTTGYLITYIVPNGDLLDVYSFYRQVTNDRNKGWEWKKSSRGADFAFLDAVWEDYEVRIVLTPPAPDSISVEVLFRHAP